MWILALLCILLGFISAIIEEAILFPALTWFVAAIALAVVSPGPLVNPFVAKRRTE